jgi:toxin HigB-1
MIRSFRCRDTEALFGGRTPRRFRTIERAAQRKLQYLDDATDVRDLAGPPGNRLEKLRGDREGQWSIRINDQWRLCFRWEGDGAHGVEIVDYH